MQNKFKIIIIFALFLAIGTSASLLIINISEKKYESKHPFFNVVKIDNLEDDPAVWGKNFPYQYESYKKTVDQIRTRFGGSEAFVKMPTTIDPRSQVAQDKLKEDPRLIRMWHGYAFSIDFREERGHAYMLLDQMFTKRQQAAAQPGTCLNCHASTYAAMMKLGDGNLNLGFEKLNKLPYQEALKHVSHPVSCLDCHDPQNMQLRVTRPAFIAGIAEFKKFSSDIHNYDVNSMASRQEMRTFVCAQCHVEYYFEGPNKKLTYPWKQGIKADEILAYYQENNHVDWTHKDTGAQMLKAQHPEFELFSQGIHARSGVSCVDCHMPYERIGAMKVTNHHVRSPLLDVDKSCRTCHHNSANELKARAELIQETHGKMRDQLLNALVDFISTIEKSKNQGIDSEKLKKAQSIHREAQFLTDFVEAENSWGFHAPQEAARIMLKALDLIRTGEILLRE